MSESEDREQKLAAELAEKETTIRRMRSQMKRITGEMRHLRDNRDLHNRYGQEGMQATVLELEARTRELAKVNDALKQTQAELIQSEKLAGIGTMAGSMAHELNTPLAAITLNAQMLELLINDSEQLEMVRAIGEAASRCEGIIGALLRYSRRGALNEFDLVDLNVVIRDACRLLEDQLSHDDVEVEIRLGDVPTIRGNHIELQQVFTNLLFNARDAIASMRKRGQVVVRTATLSNTAVAYVSDNGCGIPDDLLNRVFDPFFTTKDVGKGTGLGLAVVHRIIQAHNASVSVSSEHGEGTTFTLQFKPE